MEQFLVDDFDRVFVGEFYVDSMVPSGKVSPQQIVTTYLVESFADKRHIGDVFVGTEVLEYFQEGLVREVNQLHDKLLKVDPWNESSDFGKASTKSIRRASTDVFVL